MYCYAPNQTGWRSRVSMVVSGGSQIAWKGMSAVGMATTCNLAACTLLSLRSTHAGTRFGGPTRDSLT
jgi:hypothetical protein